MSKDNPSKKAKRGEVTKTFHDVCVLAGFMDDQHFRGFAQEHILKLTPEAQVQLFQQVQAARDAITAFPAVDLTTVELSPLVHDHIKAIEQNEMFQRIFGTVPHRFSWIDPSKLVALQAFQRIGAEVVPTDDEGLLDYALPQDWNVPAELSFTPPFGPIYVVSSSPQMAGVEVMMDGDRGHIIIKPPSHINLVQAVHFGGRYYLRNGYHRVCGALEAKVPKLPALVVEGQHPADVELPALALAGFNAGYTASLARPPLVSDFGTSGSVVITMREKRYGASVNLQISPISIGI